MPPTLLVYIHTYHHTHVHENHGLLCVVVYANTWGKQQCVRVCVCVVCIERRTHLKNLNERRKRTGSRAHLHCTHSTGHDAWRPMTTPRVSMHRRLCPVSAAPHTAHHPHSDLHASRQHDDSVSTVSLHPPSKGGGSVSSSTLFAPLLLLRRARSVLARRIQANPPVAGSVCRVEFGLAAGWTL